MANGSAGCGYEYRGNTIGSNKGYTCPALKRYGSDFTCIKYGKILKIKVCYDLVFEEVPTQQRGSFWYHEIRKSTPVEHPFRCKECGK